MDYQVIALAVLGIVALIFGVKWVQVARLLKEIGEVCFTTSEAMYDNKITKDEARKILKELADVVLAGKMVFGK